MILACDFGKKRIGVALVDEESGVILRTSAVDQTKNAIASIRGIVRDSGAQKIIVGLPLNLKCSFTESTDAAVAFAAALYDRVCRAVYFIDERFTTVSVYTTGRLLGKSVLETRRSVDAGSAVCLLDTYLKNPKTALPFSRKTMPEEAVLRMIEEKIAENVEQMTALEAHVKGLSGFRLFSGTRRQWALKELNPWFYSRYRTVEKPDAIVAYSFHYGQ
ncbi:MAG: Holliday junction resolvase RuvX [Thermotogaceae bacterium]|nr:Holliday junction resolvase RuvX [Thermotogaceae bacterium]